MDGGGIGGIDDKDSADGPQIGSIRSKNVDPEQRKEGQLSGNPANGAVPGEGCQDATRQAQPCIWARSDVLQMGFFHEREREAPAQLSKVSGLDFSLDSANEGLLPAGLCLRLPERARPFSR